MEYNFKGINPKSINLLCENHFNDSKEFYEQHKLQLKEEITVPLRQIVLDMSDFVCGIDDKMFTDPVRCVSRIYRDTRGHRSKTKYRENMWIFFRRYKNEYPNAPFYYFEFFPNGYGYGLGFFTSRPTYFQVVHQLILDKPKKFRKALKSCKEAGLTFSCTESYKKEKYNDMPEDLKPYLMAKNFQFVYFNNNIEKINNSSLIDELKLAFDIAKPMYDFMIEAYENMIELDLIDKDNI